MNFTLERLTQPALEPVTLAEAKRTIREFIGVTSRDSDIEALIVAGREWLEDFTGRIMVDQSWRLTLSGDGWPAGSAYSSSDTVAGYSGAFNWSKAHEIMLRRSPVLAITAFESVDADGVATAIDADTFELRDAGTKYPRLVALSGASWTGRLTRSALQITFRAGFADQTGSPQTGAEVVPEQFKTAIKIWVGAHYNLDEKMTPLGVDAARRIALAEKVDWALA